MLSKYSSSSKTISNSILATLLFVARMELDRVFDELDWFSKKKIEFIFCCDANFGMLPRDYDIALKAVENKKKYG